MLIAATTIGMIWAGINWTSIIVVLTICLSAMGTLIKLYGPDAKISDDTLRASEYLKSLEKDSKEKSDILSKLKDLINQQNTEVEKLKIESHNTVKGVDELKRDNTYLVQRLDNMLKQFMEYMEG